MSLNAILTIEEQNGAVITTCPGNTFKPVKSFNKTTIQLGSLFHGQSRDFVFDISGNLNDNVPFLQATIEFQLPGSTTKTEMQFQGITFTQPSPTIMINRLRIKFVETIKKIMVHMKRNNLEESKVLLNNLIKELELSGVKDNEFVADLMKDIEGQTAEAIAKADWYDKWGRHYLPSLINAHMNQFCNNFKDPGVQHYGGNMFKQIRDVVDETFCKLPPPKPTLIKKPEKATSSSSRASTSSSYSSLSSMSAYHNQNYGG